MSDDIRTFEVDPKEYEKLVNMKLDAIREILAPEAYGEEIANLEKLPEARGNRIVLDLYAAQDALFAAGPRNIRVLMGAELITEEDGAVLYVMAKLLEAKMAEALQNGMAAIAKQAEKEATKPRLSVVKGGKDDTVH